MEDTDGLLRGILILSCLGSGMMAGLFISFSTFMMKAFDSLGRAEGMRAMQAVNRFIVRPSFLLVFLGTAVLVLAAGLIAYISGGPWKILVCAAAIYVVACILSTITFNIPLNNRLEIMDPSTTEGQNFWAQYVDEWTRWNHVRALACVMTTILIAFSLT